MRLRFTTAFMRTVLWLLRRRAKANDLDKALRLNAPDKFLDDVFRNYAKEPAFGSWS